MQITEGRLKLAQIHPKMSRELTLPKYQESARKLQVLHRRQPGRQLMLRWIQNNKKLHLAVLGWSPIKLRATITQM